MAVERRGRAGKRPVSDIARRRQERRDASGRRSDTRWAEVLRGATTVFQRVGYVQSTLEDVATEVGINRATLYYYVGTKEELLVALLAGPIHDLRRGVESIAAEAIPVRDKLTALLREYVQVLDTHPELMVFLAENIHKVMSGEAADEIISDADRYGTILTALVAQGMKAGEIRDDLEPRVAVMGVLGMFNWIHRWYDPNGPLTLPDIGRGFIDMALDGLAPR